MKRILIVVILLGLTVGVQSASAGARTDLFNTLARRGYSKPTYRIPPKPRYVVPPPKNSYIKEGDEWGGISSGRSFTPPPPPPKFDLHGGKGQLTPIFGKASKN